MPLDNHTLIETWTEDDLLDLPGSETDDYEYKSSLIREHGSYRNDLQSKIVKTASAFWNTGGGILVVGVDDDGLVDGGIPEMMGKQRLRDWVDVVLTGVTPVGEYSIQTIASRGEDTHIDEGHVVLVVAFAESFDLPHMAPDNRYYVRAGAHSNPANHYLVEAIRARRGLRRPMLRAILRENPQKTGVIEIVVLTVNDLPALNIFIDFDPLPPHLQEQFEGRLPLLVPIIDRANPYRMDIANSHRLEDFLGEAPFNITLQFDGVSGNTFTHKQPLDYRRSLSVSDITINKYGPEKLLKKVYKQLSRLNNTIETYLQIEPTQPENEHHDNAEDNL